jgi:DNA invertase Pin-like site-specific DNA recombinase
VKIGILYARVSSKDQEREGFSIPAQLELLRNYAAKEGYYVLNEYAEAETAKKAGRNKFLEMVSFIKEHKQPVTILVEKTDRLYRNFKDFLLVEDLIQSQDVDVHLVKEGETIGKNANSHTKFIHGIKVLLAKNYIDNLSEEVKKGRRQKVLQGGWHTRAPYGYLNDKNKREIVVDPGTAPLVIRAYQLYATGLYSIETVIDFLQKEGFVYRPHSVKVPLSRLHEIFKSPAYIGKIPFDGEVYDGNHPGIIDLDTWLRVQSSLRKDNKPISATRRDFLYRGLLTCGECGGGLVGEIKKGKYIYYRCLSMKKGCSQGYVSESVIDEEVAAVLAGLKFPPDHKQMILTIVSQTQKMLDETANQETDRLTESKKKFQTKRRKIYEDKISGIIEAEMWQEIDRECLEQIRIFDSQLAQIDKADDEYQHTINMALELPELLDTQWILADCDEKKEFLSFIHSNFSVKDRNAHLELKEEFNLLRQMGIKEGVRK